MESKNETAKLNTDKNIYNKAHSGQTIKDIAINKKISRNALMHIRNLPNTATRLKHIMQVQKLRQVDVLALCKPFCDKYGIPIRKNDLSQYVSGKVKPNQKRLYILAKALNVSEAWLMGFDVPMQRLSKETKLNSTDQPEKIQNGLQKLDNTESFDKDRVLKLVSTYFSDDMVKLIKACDKLDKLDQGKILERIDTLLEQDKYQKEKKTEEVNSNNNKEENEKEATTK
jgi:transcriptional regulator with XRE-family HTH domain